VFWRCRIACVSLPAGTRSGLFFPSVSQFVLPLRARARHSIRLASALYFPDRFLVGAGQRARSRSCSDFRSVFLCRLGVDARVQIPFSFLPLYQVKSCHFVVRDCSGAGSSVDFDSRSDFVSPLFVATKCRFRSRFCAACTRRRILSCPHSS
jgi:hypothetical protein